MSSSEKLKNTNKLVSELSNVLSAFIEPKSLLIMHLLYKRGCINAEQIVRELTLPQDEVEQILSFLKDNDLIKQIATGFELTPLAEKRIGYGSTTLEFLVGETIKTDINSVPYALRNSYKIKKCIGNGATSYTFLAEQSETFRDRTLKIFLPDIVNYDQLKDALEKRAKIQRGEAIPEIIEAGQVKIQLLDGKSVILPCVVLEYIEAVTFEQFLISKENINARILERFIERIGGALAAIEKVGLEHGDLHEGNILVVTDESSSEAKDFYVIDFIGVASYISPEFEVLSDIENFRDHILRAAIISVEKYPGLSARLLLGDRVFRVLDGLRNGNYNTFNDVLDDFNRKEDDLIPDNHFKSPKQEPFEWLRVEWFSSPSWLYTLFEPVPSRFETISHFGNTWISGPRGCGKSHYLRIFEFHPSVIVEAESNSDLNDKLKQINYDFRKSFGVLFACRLGEFKSFDPEAMGEDHFDFETKRFLKHILILKIWNKTLITIKDGLESFIPSTNRPVIEIPHDIHEICEFLEERLGKMAFVNDNPKDLFLQCISVCSAKESSAISVWNDESRRPNIRLLNERDLDEFFGAIKRTFFDLSQTRFFILVDDVSYGHIHFEMQKILNSLFLANHANHCFKITYEKILYIFETADNRSIDPYNDGSYVDLGEISTKSKKDPAINLSEYMARVINSRLKAAKYEFDIQTILGKSQNSKEFLSALSIPGARRPVKGVKQSQIPRKNAYYAGWNIVWSISHGSVRTLLELIEHIFMNCEVKLETNSISLKDQDAAVRNFSNMRYKSISMQPGEIEGEHLGAKLQAVIGAIGEISRLYLEKYETGEKDRWYETISIERLDLNKLNKLAEKVLFELMKNDFLVVEGITFSRAQFGLSNRYDINKIFAPAFQTTYRVRNHIYLSKKRFEELLLFSDIFVRKFRNKLGKSIKRSGKGHQRTLFSVGDE